MNKFRQPCVLLSALILLAACMLPATALPCATQGQAKKSPIPEMVLALNLTEEQKKKLEPIYAEQQKQHKAARQDGSLSEDARKGKLREINQATDRQLKDILTPEQFQKLREQRKARQQGKTPDAPKKPE